MKKVIIALLLSAIAASANAEENLSLQYEAHWSGLKVGEMKVIIEEKQAEYKFTALVDSVGILRRISKYWGVNYTTGKISAGKYIPLMFDSKWKPKKTDPQQIIVNYSKDGEEVSEVATPPEDRNKRPLLEVKEKKNTYDPITAGVLARKQLREVIASGKPLPHNFSIPTFDGRRVFNLNFSVLGYENRTVKGTEQKLLHVRLDRTPLAGFRAKELDKMRKEEPVFDIYVNDDYVPVWALGKAPIGQTTITLAKSCTGAECEL